MYFSGGKEDLRLILLRKLILNSPNKTLLIMISMKLFRKLHYFDSKM